VSEYSSFNLQNLTVFGDNLNDIGMFELANKAVAVANSHEDVLALADEVSAFTNEEDAVARYLESLRE
jgi:hypothetical protein